MNVLMFIMMYNGCEQLCIWKIVKNELRNQFHSEAKEKSENELSITMFTENILLRS